MNQNQILDQLDALITQGESQILKSKFSNFGTHGGVTSLDPTYYVDGSLYESWITKLKRVLRLFLSPTDDTITKIAQLSQRNTCTSAKTIINIIKDLKSDIESGMIKIKDESAEADSSHETMRMEQIFDLLFTRFHSISKSLLSRYNNRATLTITDEYDVQDLLQALLKLFFDDIRREEWTPSYAGKSARVDFLLKKEKTVIEIKMARKGLTGKELGDQLICDIERYKAHEDCQKLICFVYDPDEYINNPVGIKSDLESQHPDFLKIYIEPNR